MIMNNTADIQFNPVSGLEDTPRADTSYSNFGSEKNGCSGCETAGFQTRAIAFFIDITILGILFSGCFVMFGLQFVDFLLQVVDINQVAGVAFLFLLLSVVVPPFAAGVYFIVMHSCSGQTIGKWIMGLRVVMVPYGRLSFGGAFLRCVCIIISALPFGAGFLWAALDREHLTLHDKLASTKVIVVEK